jgi:transaldolase
MKTIDELKEMTTLVVDSSDLEVLKNYPARDATTNPTLVLQAAENPRYLSIIEKALIPLKGKNCSDEDLVDAVLIAFGLEILAIVPGRVSTEVDAQLSFSTTESIKRAKKLINLYEKAGIERKRVLIKLASTWECLQAAKELEKEGIHCNMTLLFSIPQAILAAQVGATLISPFVGRILDWHKKHKGFQGTADEDPGVLSVRKIFEILKGAGSPIEIMGASFRNIGEIIALAGCDLLTISPQLFDELQTLSQSVSRKLTPPIEKKALPFLDESTFRFQFNEDEMAVDKLAEGIRKFAADTRTLTKLLKEKFS